MSLFKKIFSKKDNPKTNQKDEQSKYAPDKKLPIDERFTLNFKNNGGKFLYAEDFDEVLEYISKILQENSWSNSNALFFNNHLSNQFKSLNLNTTVTLSEATYFVTTCEKLIANDGSILICSNQIAEKKLSNLPQNFIVFATTSQLVETISDGLQYINSNRGHKIPSNITTMKHFKPTTNQDFLSYGSSSKNLYLLLLEDL